MLEDLLDHFFPLDENEDSHLTLAFFVGGGILCVPRPRRLEGSRKILAKDFSNLTIDKLFILFFYNQYEFRPFDWLLNFLYLDTTF